MDDIDNIRKPWTTQKAEGSDMDGETDQKYITKNLYEAAYCLAIGLEIVKRDIVTNSRGKRNVALTFSGKDAEKRAMNYYAETEDANVNARKLMDCYRTIKDYVFM